MTTTKAIKSGAITVSPAWGFRARGLDTFEAIARNPYRAFSFHRGPYYARQYLGYPEADLASLPPVALDRFTGVGNPFAAGDLYPGETVLNLGCGAGTDLLIAARRVGPEGRVTGLDGSSTMLACARMAVRAAGLTARIELRNGDLQHLPVDDGSVDLVIANGVLGTTEERLLGLREMQRVLKPGGRAYVADLVAERRVAFNRSGIQDLWTSFLQGNPTAEELTELAARAGLRQVRLVACYDCLRNAPLAGSGLRRPRIHGVTLFAVK